MASNPKHSNRVVVYFTDEQYIDLLKSAARFDKTPGEYMRFEMLRSMHGSLGLGNAYGNSKRSAFECSEEGDE